MNEQGNDFMEGYQDGYPGYEIIDNRGMFKRPFSFEGRIRRTEYCLSLLIYYVVIYVVAFFAGVLVGTTGSNGFMALYFLFLIPGAWFLWAQGTKRCHDLGHSGWFQFIPFYVFWMIFAPGDRETTGYGTSPKAV